MTLQHRIRARAAEAERPEPHPDFVRAIAILRRAELELAALDMPMTEERRRVLEIVGDVEGGSSTAPRPGCSAPNNDERAEKLKMEREYA